MNAHPIGSLQLSAWEASPSLPGRYALTEVLPGGLAAHANVAVRSDARRMVVFLPGAQTATSPRRVPLFHRWTWQEDLPDMHVVALGDPSIALDESILGGWFMHPELDLIAELASIVERIAVRLGIPARNVTFHGSSLGGFGAIGIAAQFRGSSAISEIPQIDVARWPVPNSIRKLEELVRMPLSEFRKLHPERVDIVDRMRFAGVIPPFTLVTNVADKSYDEQLAFMDDIETLRSECESLGEQRLIVTDLTTGHRPLLKEDAIDLLRRIGTE